MTQLVKNPPAVWEAWVQSPGWEDPLEKGKATHSSILTWRVHGVAKSQTQLSDFNLLGFQLSWLRMRLQCRRPQFDSWVGKICRRRDRLPLQYSWASLVAQLVKNPLAMQETWVRSLSWEDPLEKGKATHSSILAWRIPWTV